MINPELEIKLEVSEPVLEPLGGQEGFSCLWTVPGDLPYLEGHFPGQPVVPGVAIIDATIAALLKRASHSKWDIVTAKFLRPLVPGQTVRIVFTHQQGLWNVEWTVKDGDLKIQTIAEMVIRLN